MPLESFIVLYYFVGQKQTKQNTHFKKRFIP